MFLLFVLVASTDARRLGGPLATTRRPIGRGVQPLAAASDEYYDEDDELTVLERESVRNSAALSPNKKEGRTQVFGAWLDDDIVDTFGETLDDKLDAGVGLMRRGMYDQSVAAFEEAVRGAGGENTSKGGQMCVWLAQALYAKGDVAVAVELLERLATSHSNRNVRKAAFEIKYILSAPQLKLSAENFVQFPEAPNLNEKRGKKMVEYAKMVKSPERWTLEWVMMQPDPKEPKDTRDPLVYMSVVSIVGTAIYFAVVIANAR